MRFPILLVSAAVLALASGCAGNPMGSLAAQCDNGLKAGYRELNFAKANGLDGTVEYTKAASLLGAAKIQSEFGKYPNCIDKVNRARAYIRKSRQ